jgi:hypothetical protein
MKTVTTIALLIIITGFTHAQNVGIGTTTPAYKLDVAGRMRLQSQPGQSAGLYFDGTSTPARSFIGTINEDHVGIFGGVAGWKFAMNVVNGYVGIGTAAPTSGLDLNGDIRIR